jgi:hypothetical protein
MNTVEGSKKKYGNTDNLKEYRYCPGKLGDQLI